MVSIIACTMRSAYMDNLFANYERQDWPNKELIIILNNDQMDIRAWKERAQQYKVNEVRVYQLPQRYMLGKCLNWAIARAKGTFIAKFDDDDYYAPAYLRESVNALRAKKAPVVGKHTCYVYFEEKRALMEYRKGREKKHLGRLKGGTLVFRKEVWRKIKFRENQVAGSDSQWLKECRDAGIPIYSVSKNNYVCIRRRDTNSHTQKRSTEAYMSMCQLIAHTDNFIPYITTSDMGSNGDIVSRRFR
ncbi:glycosyltransferase family 2 protein [Paenibacillus sp. SI8]|uniref:glycosyltransferase family 2 protein n=1 Tax=unclassified Paenibacillus TaxID=185978 RepID=UPI00346623CB